MNLKLVSLLPWVSACSAPKTEPVDTGTAPIDVSDTAPTVDDTAPTDDDTAPTDPDTGVLPFSGDVTAEPGSIDGVLTNTGMGFADFHFGWWCNLPPITFTPEECVTRVEEHWPDNYPDAGTAYFRWSWADIAPEPGVIDTELIDTTIQTANLLGETLGIRIMAILEGGYGVPEWLTEPPYSVAGEWINSMFWPDVRDPVFLDEHAAMLAALGERYNGHPGVDHVDIGTVGCWGEWNTACLTDAADLFDVYQPTTTEESDEIQAAYEAMVDHHLTAFSDTPVVMLGIGGEPGREVEILAHAVEGGAGWRVDCWGDYGIWGSGWNHMEDYYPAMISAAEEASPGFSEVWQTAPVQLEVCSTMSDWEALGWTTDGPDGEVTKTFAWSTEVHASVLNAKFSDLPDAYVGAIDVLLEENGYRLGLSLLNHSSTVQAGESLILSSRWTNTGTAPPYLPRTLTWRLRNGDQTTEISSEADIRAWIPGEHEVVDVVDLATDLAPGTYDVDVALLDRAGTEPETAPLPPTHLATEGRDEDGWVVVSQLTVE